ncbi:hypothetical protein ASPCADRAFT_207938 [Aspergillus carbonarius ITEM 5010]|uniref:Uncharacterized protein n=1 Tax=Aspergillus carbonarius (strain ITEM 5010) TaxID=602072 RepID=A0A1R3RLU5_ASPC5|nr:hypothetical protein ASPCADRAFT_207938 [Aspergillus carbonarius ITEM 5010]
MSPSPQSTTTTKNLDLASKRRRFQPPITNYFTTTPSTPISTNNTTTTTRSHHLSYNHYSTATCSPTPIVPTRIQASLLSVGMRIRKSVAEGYKTNLAKSDPAFSRNLITDDEGDAFSLPASSQDSDAQASGHKRAYDLDDIDEDSEREGEGEGCAQHPFVQNGTISGRTILAPRSNQQRRRFVALKRYATTGSMDIDDFEEPTFLSREEVDMDYMGVRGGGEIEMGGV